MKPGNGFDLWLCLPLCVCRGIVDVRPFSVSHRRLLAQVLASVSLYLATATVVSQAAAWICWGTVLAKWNGLTWLPIYCGAAFVLTCGVSYAIGMDGAEE